LNIHLQDLLGLVNQWKTCKKQGWNCKKVSDSIIKQGGELKPAELEI
jgi:hypothetical protein